MTWKEMSKFWGEASDRDWDTSQRLFEVKKYSEALFFVHLSTEKTLKSLHYFRLDTHPLPIHKLEKLALDAGFEATEEENEQLKEISRFNISARYDDYKRSFYELATLKYTIEWIKKAEKLRLIIRDLLKI